MKNPMISVVMPTYNSEKYVAEAVESILSQTFEDFEFLIINDGSTDKTVQILKSFEDPRIKIIHNKCNIGVAESLNEGIRQSKGKYIARMDSDDVSLPKRFERQVAFMEENPDIAICGTWAEFIGDRAGFNCPRTEKEYVKSCLLLNVEVLHPSVFLRTSEIKQHDLWYNPKYLPEDYELFSRAAQLVSIVNIPEVLLKYRTSGDNITLVKADLMIKQSCEIIARNLKSLGIDVPLEKWPLLHSLKSFLKSENDLTYLNELFSKIIKANYERCLYNDDALKYVLERHRMMLFNPSLKTDFPKEIADIITQNAFEMSEKSNICLFGLGKAFRDLAHYFTERIGSRISCVSDNSPGTWGKSYLGLECIPPDSLLAQKEQIGIIVLANYDNVEAIIKGLKDIGLTNVKPYVDTVF